MNTQPRTLRLSAGQSLLLSSRIAGPPVLVQGEVLVQGPAQWLGGVVVVPTAVRVSGPALLPGDGAASVVAVRDAVVLVQERPAVVALFSSFLARLRLRRYAAMPVFGADRHA